MKIKIELISETFFFLDGLNISKPDGSVDVDLEDKSDDFISSIITSISVGVLSSNKKPADLIGLIKNDKKLESLSKRLGIEIGKIKDTTKAKPEIIKVELEEPQIESTEDEVNEIFTKLLKGSNRVVSTRIKDAVLSDEDKATALKIEKEGRNRAVVKKLLGE